MSRPGLVFKEGLAKCLFLMSLSLSAYESLTSVKQSAEPHRPLDCFSNAGLHVWRSYSISGILGAVIYFLKEICIYIQLYTSMQK